MPDEDAYEEICGETFDHHAETTYEDDELIQWRCNYCGAEGEEDKDDRG